jgi:hypothetical protein
MDGVSSIKAQTVRSRQSIPIMQLKWIVNFQSWLCEQQRVAMAAAQSPEDFLLKAEDVDLKQLPWVKLLQQHQDSAFVLAEVPPFLSDLDGSMIQVDDCSDCLWTALREALVHIGVSTLADDLRTEIMKYLSSKEFSKDFWFDPPKQSVKYQTVRNPVVVVMFIA